MRDMRTDFYTEIGEAEYLPFQLELLVGKGDKEQIVNIDKLADSSQEFAKFLYNIQEFRSIRISMKAQEEITVRIIWDRLSDKAVYVTPYSFILSQNIQSVTIYEQGVTDEYYPWNCGIYCFEVQFEGVSYWGGFQVIPKNLTNEQLYDVHELIHQEVKGLSLESERKNRTYQDREKDSPLELELGLLEGDLKKLERKVQLKISGLSDIPVEELLRNIRKQSLSLEVLEKSLKKEENTEEIEEKLFLHGKKVKRLKDLLSYRGVNSNISIYDERFQVSQPHVHIRPLALKKDSVLSHQENGLQPFKPTYLVYEYYCYFLLINILKELKFIPYPDFEQQLSHILINNVLSEPSTIVLKRDQLHIHVVYNDIIDHYVFADYPLKSGLCSLEERRKPDVHMDLYIMDEGKLKFLSTIVFEVKYSPIFNIYQKYSNTKAMDQLKKYWSLKFVDTNDVGRAVFLRAPVSEVICLYPGSHQHPTVLDTPIALFIQNFPKRTSKDKTIYVGKYEIKGIVANWLSQEERRGKRSVRGRKNGSDI